MKIDLGFISIEDIKLGNVVIRRHEPNGPNELAMSTSDLRKLHRAIEAFFFMLGEQL